MNHYDVSSYDEYHPPQWKIDQDKDALFYALVFGDAAGAGVTAQDQEGSGLMLFHGGALDLYRGRGIPAEAHFEALRREIAPHMTGEGFKDWLKSSFKTVGKQALQAAGQAALSGAQAGFSSTQGSFTDKLKAGLKSAAKDAGNAALKSSAGSITQQFSQPKAKTMQPVMSQPVMSQPVMSQPATSQPSAVQKILESLA